MQHAAPNGQGVVTASADRIDDAEHARRLRGPKDHIRPRAQTHRPSVETAAVRRWLCLEGRHRAISAIAYDIGPAHISIHTYVHICMLLSLSQAGRAALTKPLTYKTLAHIGCGLSFHTKKCSIPKNAVLYFMLLTRAPF